MKRQLFRLGRSGTWTETGRFEVAEERLSKIEELSEEPSELKWSPDSLNEVLDLQAEAIGVSLLELEPSEEVSEKLIEL